MDKSLFLALLAVSTNVTVAEDSSTHPLEPGDRSSPRATLQTFISECDKANEFVRLETPSRISDYQREMVLYRILRCLDLSQIPEYRRETAGKEAVVNLKEVLDRIELPPFEDIPESGPWTIPHTQISIAKIPSGIQQGEYVFTSETVDRSSNFYEAVKHLPYRRDVKEGFRDWYLSHPKDPTLSILVRWLPGWARSRVLGQSIWQWCALLGIVIASCCLLFLLYRVGSFRSDRFQNSNLRYWITLWFPVAAMGIPIGAKRFTEVLGVSGGVLVVVQFIADLAFLITAVVVVLAVERRITQLFLSSPKIHEQGLDAQFIRLVGRVAGIFAATLLVLEGGRRFGIPITTLLAGAGVGGLAVALAAQDTLKNLFGSLMITLDKPYRVGDRIVVKGYDGVVEEIGLRSSKIRLLTGHLVTLPNEEMARLDIENVAKRVHIRRVQDISLSFETAPEKIEDALKIIRSLLENHEGQAENYPPRVYIDKFNPDSINLRFFCWYHPADYWKYLAFSEKLNLEIARQFHEAQIEFARPSLANYLVNESNPTPQTAD